MTFAARVTSGVSYVFSAYGRVRAKLQIGVEGKLARSWNSVLNSVRSATELFISNERCFWSDDVRRHFHAHDGKKGNVLPIKTELDVVLDSKRQRKAFESAPSPMRDIGYQLTVDARLSHANAGTL